MHSSFRMITMTGFQIVKVRRMGQDCILSIPRHMIQNVKTNWMKVTISADGRLVYEPISEAI